MTTITAPPWITSILNNKTCTGQVAIHSYDQHPSKLPAIIRWAIANSVVSRKTSGVLVGQQFISGRN